VDAFVARYWADRDEGRHPGLAQYLAEFPGAEAGVARAWLAMEGGSEQREDSVTHASPGGLRQIGPYRLDEEIGRGGQGVVYRATDTRLGRSVALKVLSGLGPVAGPVLERFKREAAVASRLDHPGICPVYDADVEGGVPWIAMRFVEG
jgi:hypothetical protein